MKKRHVCGRWSSQKLEQPKADIGQKNIIHHTVRPLGGCLLGINVLLSTDYNAPEPPAFSAA
jgi:hypothetical protein